MSTYRPAARTLAMWRDHIEDKLSQLDTDNVLHQILTVGDRAAVGRRLDKLALYGAMAVPARFGQGMGTIFRNFNVDDWQRTGVAVENLPPIADGLIDPYTVFAEGNSIDEKGNFVGFSLKAGRDALGLDHVESVAAISLLTDWQPGQDLRVMAPELGLSPELLSAWSYHLGGVQVSAPTGEPSLTPTPNGLTEVEVQWQPGTKYQNGSGGFGGTPVTQPWLTRRLRPARDSPSQ